MLRKYLVKHSRLWITKQMHKVEPTNAVNKCNKQMQDVWQIKTNTHPVVILKNWHDVRLEAILIVADVSLEIFAHFSHFCNSRTSTSNTTLILSCCTYNNITEWLLVTHKFEQKTRRVCRTLDCFRRYAATNYNKQTDQPSKDTVLCSVYLTQNLQLLSNWSFVARDRVQNFITMLLISFSKLIMGAFDFDRIFAVKNHVGTK